MTRSEVLSKSIMQLEPTMEGVKEAYLIRTASGRYGVVWTYQSADINGQSNQVFTQPVEFPV